MPTNVIDPSTDDDKPVTEEDLRSLKYDTEVDDESQDESVDTEDTEVTDDTSEELDQIEDDTNDESEDESTDESDEEESEFVKLKKEFPYIKGDNPEDFAVNLAKAYQNSTAEALRLKKLADQSAPDTTATDTDQSDIELGESEQQSSQPDLSNPLVLWAQQQIEKDMDKAYADIIKQYPQVLEEDNYKAFTKRVRIVARSIRESDGRVAPPDEVYKTAVSILGWQPQTVPSGKDRLDDAVKNQASSSKAPSAPSKSAPKSKVTEEMIAINRKMYPGKTDAEIRQELEDYVM